MTATIFLAGGRYPLGIKIGSLNIGYRVYYNKGGRWTLTTEYCIPTIATQEKRVYTVAEVAKILCVHPNTVYKLVKKNVFASIKVGTDIRISKTSFDAWLENQI